MFNSALVMAALLSAAASGASERMSLRFEDLPSLVKDGNGHARAAQDSAQAAERRTGHWLRSYLPSLYAEVGGEYFATGGFSTRAEPYGTLETRINLFRGGRDALEENVREGRSQQAQAQAQRAYFDSLSEARKTYWQLVYQREVSKVLRATLELNQKNMAAALKRIGSGLSIQTDKLEFEIAKTQLDQDLSRMELENTKAQRKLAALLGKALDTAVDTDSVVPHEHNDSLLKEPLNVAEHRDVRALKATQLALDAQRSQAYRWWTPSLEVYGNTAVYTVRDRGFVDFQDRRDLIVGVRLSFELFDGLRAKSEGAAAALEANGADTQAQQSARELAANFENARQELQLMHEMLHEGERNTEKGQDYLSRTLAEYSRGVKTSPDVLGATLRVLDLRRRYAELRRDYQIARSDLMALLGR